MHGLRTIDLVVAAVGLATLAACMGMPADPSDARRARGRSGVPIDAGLIAA